MTAKKFIDFKTLKESELKLLSEKWERDATIVEFKLERLSQNSGGNLGLAVEEQITRLRDIAHKLWKRLSILETWRINNKGSKRLK